MKAYENGCTALKILRSKQGITLERVEDVMDEMNEVKKYILSHKYREILRVGYSVATSPKDEWHAVSNE